MRSFPLAGVAAAAIGLGLLAAPAAAEAAPVGVVAAPASPAYEFGARMRWGATGFEASIFDENAAGGINQNPTLDPRGAPVWQVGRAHRFLVSFSGGTGEVTLSVDFDRDGAFGIGETIARAAFAAPGETSYAGFGFEALRISVDQTTSAGGPDSQVTNLVINGQSQAAIAPGAGNSAAIFYGTGAPVSDWLIEGDLTFLTVGAAQERPSWNFKFANAGAVAVPAPGGLALLGLGLLGVAALRRRP